MLSLLKLCTKNTKTHYTKRYHDHKTYNVAIISHLQNTTNIDITDTVFLYFAQNSDGNIRMPVASSISHTC